MVSIPDFTGASFDFSPSTGPAITKVVIAADGASATLTMDGGTTARTFAVIATSAGGVSD